MAFKPAWATLFIITTVLVTESSPFGCNQIDTNKCLCFTADDIDVQCPIEDSQISLSVSKNNHVNLQCLRGSAPYIDLDVIPDMDISGTKLFKMEFCYLNVSFTEILQKFHIQDLNALYFETLAQEQVDMNITLSRESFGSLESLQSLTLSYSTIYLSEDFLANTPNLLALVLSKNTMGELQQNYFQYVPRLKMLELSRNQITVLPDGIFKDLFNLTRLMLFGNNISSLSKNTFMGLKNLQLLEVSSNHIQELSEDAFGGLHKLVNISLRANKIRRIYSNTFANNSLLENIRLGSNTGIVLSEQVFANLKVLRTVELFLNHLESVPENLFLNSEKLEEINFKNNLLTTLPEKLFQNLTKLKALDLSENKLNLLPDDVFSSLENLQILNLSKNKLTLISQYLFKSLYRLNHLDLHGNLISVIDLQAFFGLQNSLARLDLSFNQWNNSYDVPAELGTSPLNPLINLEELIVSHNEIHDIPLLIASLKLKILDLSFNRIDYFAVRTFAHTVSYTLKLDLSNNKIEEIDFQLAELLSRDNTRLSDASDYHDSVIVKLTNNPIICDCRNYDLVRYNNFEMKELRTLVQLDQEGLVCFNNSTNQTMKVLNLKPYDIECPVTNGCPSSASCKCLYKPYDKAIVVDCSFSNFTSYPSFSFKEDEYFYNQTSLILRGNALTKGPSALDVNYSNVTVLDLSANFIADVDWIPPYIKELNLNNNLLKNLDQHFIKKLKNATSLQRLHLKGNLWECSCKSLDLQKYLMQYYHKVNSSDVFCKTSHIQLVKLTDICKVSPYLSIMLPIVLAVFLCFAIAFAIYYRYQTEIKIYLFAKNMCLWFVTEEELDKDKTYDVFISYSHQDEKFVVDHLLSELENGDTPFKVCIHMRDWIPGEFIAEQVVNSVKDSRRTIVVLSTNFVDSVWGKLEFRTAHTQAISEGRARVVVLIYGDLDESKLDTELQSYLKTNTYIKWGDKYFWNKLRYALPHSRNNFYEKNKKQAKVMLKIDDKFDLIKNPPSPSNTSTPPITLDPSLLESKELHISVEGENPLLSRQV